MRDFFVEDRGGFNFVVESDRKALMSQIGVFLSIEATNNVRDGELYYDINQGLNYDLLFSFEVDKVTKEKHVYNKLKLYYPAITELKVSITEENRETKIKVEYKSEYSSEIDNVEVKV